MNPPTTTENKRRRYSAAEKNEILAAYEQRTTTQLGFCEERGLCMATLRNWLAKGRPSNADLVELPSARIAEDDFCVQLELSDSTVLRIAVGTDPRWLRQLLQVLRCGA